MVESDISEDESEVDLKNDSTTESSDDDIEKVNHIRKKVLYQRIISNYSPFLFNHGYALLAKPNFPPSNWKSRI